MLNRLKLTSNNKTSSIPQEQSEKATQNGKSEAEAGQKAPNPQIQEAEYSESLEGYSQEQGKAPSTDEQPSHFDHLIESEVRIEDEQHAAEVQSNLIGRDDFHALFCHGFTTASYITGLKSLAVESSDGGAVACTGALYDTIVDIPALHFLLMPQGKWLERAVAIGMFTIPMAGAVSQELKAKKAAAKPKKPDGGNEPPTGKAMPAEYTSLREMAEKQEG